MPALNRLLDRLRAKPVPVAQPVVVPTPVSKPHPVNFDDLLRALGADF